LQEDFMSSKETLEQSGSCWEGLEDPRGGIAALHEFHQLLMIALCCVLCGGQGAVDLAVFAETKEPFLRSFLTVAGAAQSSGSTARGIENSLHWRLYSVMNEDQDGTRRLSLTSLSSTPRWRYLCTPAAGGPFCCGFSALH
jgi:DDE_Tnp_1-associated